MTYERKNLGYYAAVLKRRKWNLILPAVIIFLITAVITFLVSPIYQSTSTIFLEEQEVPKDLVISALRSFAEQKIQTISQRVLNTSRLLEVINRFNLYPDLHATWSTDEIVDRMRDKDIKLETISIDIAERQTGRPIATIAFTLSFRGKDPAKVQQVANVLTLLYLEENLNLREKYDEENNNADELIKKSMETGLNSRLERGQKGARFTLIEPARLPKKPVTPNIPVMLLIGLVLGVAAGAGTAAIREFNDTSVRSAEELSRGTDFPVLASIPEIVVHDEKMERRKKAFTMLAGIAVALIIGLLVFHFEFMELDVLWARLMRGITI